MADPPIAAQTAARASQTSGALSSEAVLDALKIILLGAPLNQVLTSVARLIEAHSDGMLCSIFLLDEDGQHLRCAAAPSLPEPYRAATDGLAIGPSAGACGTAAYLREPVFTGDIFCDPKWLNFKDAAKEAGLRAAWSSPILSSDGKVLGTFGMHYREIRHPQPAEIALIEYASRIALIAIERQRSQTKQRQDEEELRRIVDLIPQTIVVLNAGGGAIYANRAVLDYTGMTIEDVTAPGFRERLFHAEDIERNREKRKRALECGLPFEAEHRALRKDGQYRWFLTRYNPFRNERGEIIRWYATGTDIDERVRAEEITRNENLALREQIDRDSMFEDIVGSSESLRRVLRQVAKVAPADSTVLILGETGTGKELIARAIHKRSGRADRAFIGVNCAAIPTSLIASELFGHEKGAFTGATQRRLGRFESANGGTMFLDEVGDMPAEIQIALLRVLQEQEIERVGSSRPIPVDVRVLAATHRDLSALVAEGKFRRDLFYRLNVVPVEMPPLRERAEDIPLLVAYFIARFGKKAGKKFGAIDKQTLRLFESYEWPGNVRELQNVIERAVILSEGDTFSVDEAWLRRELPMVQRPTRTLGGALAAQEKEMIEAALDKSQGRISGPNGAAEKLGLPARTLDSKIKRLRINKYRFKSARAD